MKRSFHNAAKKRGASYALMTLCFALAAIAWTVSIFVALDEYAHLELPKRFANLGMLACAAFLLLGAVFRRRHQKGLPLSER